MQTSTLTPPDGHASLYPDLQIGPEGVAALTWFDERDGNQEVYLQLFAAGDGALAPTGEPRRISHGPADSIGAYIAWNGATLGLAWSDYVITGDGGHGSVTSSTAQFALLSGSG
ncbi:hypothetical protein [Aurantiacibacter flavus]|uniref:Uncharacterized protein n=1 Tax=Aurantiacibacter flavus TaxID=3145232 RepID=A0ABV0D045_9SPHN